MRSDLILSARIESIIWEALAENDLHMRLSAREKLATELVALVRDQQAEAWDEGRAAQAVHEAFVRLAEGESTTPPKPQPNPYRQETDA